MGLGSSNPGYIANISELRDSNRYHTPMFIATVGTRAPGSRSRDHPVHKYLADDYRQTKWDPGTPQIFSTFERRKIPVICSGAHW